MGVSECQLQLFGRLDRIDIDLCRFRDRTRCLCKKIIIFGDDGDDDDDDND